MSIRILLADDHAVLRAGLRMLLDAESGIEVVGEASTGAEAIQLAGQVNPDIVLLDISMPGLSGADALKSIVSRDKDAKVVVLTMHDDTIYLRRLMGLGAKGYVLKSAADRELIRAIRTVNDGGKFIEPSLAGEFVTEFVVNPERKSTDGISTLSPRELEVLEYVAYGYSNREAAEQLHISVKTVETHRRRVMDKLQLRTRAELVRYAIQAGVLADE